MFRDILEVTWLLVAELESEPYCPSLGKPNLGQKLWAGRGESLEEGSRPSGQGRDARGKVTNPCKGARLGRPASNQAGSKPRKGNWHKPEAPTGRVESKEDPLEAASWES